MPEGWEKQAWELGAMRRRRGVIQSPSSLLRLNMLYVTNGGSFAMAALGMGLTEGITLSKVAAFERIGKSTEWLRWMAKGLLERDGMALEKPEFLGDRRVILYDASDEAVKGSCKSDYRLHYGFDLFNFQSKSVEVTSCNEGEKLTRYSMSPGEIAIADRAYCTVTGIEHGVSSGAEFVLRYRVNSFLLYDEAGERIDLLARVRHLKALENADIRGFYRHGRGLRPIRIVAMKKEHKAVEQSRRKMAREAGRKQRKPVRADTAELNEYIVLATNLEDTNAQVIELYRARWQVEQVFYRLKSLFGYGDTPNRRSDTTQSWFYGKLELAALCESIHKRMSFPPEIEPALATIIGTQFME